MALPVEMPNPQFDYDHRQDQALFMDSDFVQRKLRSMQNAYETYRESGGCPWRTGMH